MFASRPHNSSIAYRIPPNAVGRDPVCDGEVQKFPGAIIVLTTLITLGSLTSVAVGAKNVFPHSYDSPGTTSPYDTTQKFFSKPRYLDWVWSG